MNFNNNTEAWNKITQTHDLFKKIIAPLKQHLGINFGYMIVFNDGSYYQIIEDLECLKKWVTNVETSHIFCARNVTTYFDEPYNFTIWLEEPTCPAMEIYKEYGMWNGITVSKANKDYTELYWFTKQNAQDDWHKWFIRNKIYLINFIKYFDSFKEEFDVNNDATFKFRQGFTVDLVKSKYFGKESIAIRKSAKFIELNSNSNSNFNLNFKLSPREIQVISLISQSYTYKMAARELLISPTTILYHVENIKQKLGVRTKFELIKLYSRVI